MKRRLYIFERDVQYYKADLIEFNIYQKLDKVSFLFVLASEFRMKYFPLVIILNFVSLIACLSYTLPVEYLLLNKI